MYTTCYKNGGIFFDIDQKKESRLFSNALPLAQHEEHYKFVIMLHPSPKTHEGS